MDEYLDDDDETRSVFISIRCSPRMRQLYRLLAKSRGETVSDTIRNVFDPLVGNFLKLKRTDEGPR